ncbi:MAG: hypothetical protein ISR29_04790 [SAR86 cluster bacterium]|uniref:Uncharacterized protein n=1 Tax=SAR86 cluster bacterium TaxID=2030880 RepID=A0A937M2M7_9GAMM|nr:hypothetical protein [SAR86 cluster bacterium]
MQNRIIFVVLVATSSCATIDTYSPLSSDIPIINKAYDAKSTRCVQETLGANKPRIRGDEISPIVEHYDYFDCLDSENYDDAVENINNSINIKLPDDKKFIETIELDPNDESKDLNCELNLTGISPKNQPNSKYYNCSKNRKK